MHTNSTLYARIGPQWLGELRRLWPSVPLRVACGLVPDRFPHYAWTAAWSALSDFVGSRVYACLAVTCLPHFRQNDRGLLRAAA